MGAIYDEHIQLKSDHREKETDSEGFSHLVSQDESVHNVNDLFMGTWKVRSHLADQPLLT